MLTLSRINQIMIGAVLIALLFITRGDHITSLSNLPAASLAVFFLAGFYLRAKWMFSALLAICFGIDFYAITAGGVSSFCVSPAYGFLVPAYAALWFAGRWFSKQYSFSFSALLPFAASVSVGAIISELLSSGGFYFFSGRFAETSLAVFGERLATYFPHQLEGLGFWLGIALIVHIAFAFTQQDSHAQA